MGCRAYFEIRVFLVHEEWGWGVPRVLNQLCRKPGKVCGRGGGCALGHCLDFDDRLSAMRP